MIVLTDPANSQSVSLDPEQGWRWTDEFEWQPVKQTLTRSLTGAAIVQSSQAKGARPITLGGESAWLVNGDVELLNRWAAIPGKTLNLALRGALYKVMFRHQDTPALVINPIVDYDDRTDGDYFAVTIKLMEAA